MDDILGATRLYSRSDSPFPLVDTTAKGATRDLNTTMKTAARIVSEVMDDIDDLFPQVRDQQFHFVDNTG